MPMDPQIKALAAIKREISKIISSITDKDDKLMAIDFAERHLATLKADIVGKN